MTAEHLLLIGIDVLRVDRAFHTGLAPTLDLLAATGAFHRSRVEVPTISGPGWTTILTGASHAEHGVVDNHFRNHRIKPDSDILSRAWQEDPTTRTTALVGWGTLGDPAGPAPVISTRRDQIDAGLHDIVCRDGEMHGYRLVDQEIARRAELMIADSGPDVSFVYLAQTDDAGHLWGVFSDEYDEAIRMTDQRVGNIVRAVEQRVEDLDERWLVAVTTDHGHVDAGGHGGGTEKEMQTFLCVAAFGGDPVAGIPTELAPNAFAEWLLALRRRSSPFIRTAGPVRDSSIGLPDETVFTER
jgi:hypothetical protein